MVVTAPSALRAALAGWRWPSGKPRRESAIPPPAVGPTARLYAYLGPDMALTQMHDGHFIYVDPADESLSAHLIGRGYWERWIESVVRGLVRPGDRVVEVGANLGYYTLIMAAAVGPTGAVHSFEA